MGHMSMPIPGPLAGLAVLLVDPSAAVSPSLAADQAARDAPCPAPSVAVALEMARIRPFGLVLAGPGLDAAAVAALSAGLARLDPAPPLVRLTGLGGPRPGGQSPNAATSGFHDMFHANAAIKLLIDPATGRIMDANPAAVAFYGYRLEQFRRLTIFDINRMPQKALRNLMNRPQGTHGRPYRFRHHLAGGEVRDVSVFSGPIRLCGQTFLFSIIYDITRQRRAEAALRRSMQEKERLRLHLEAVVRGIPDAIVSVDEHFRLRQRNAACARVCPEMLDLAPGLPITPPRPGCQERCLGVLRRTLDSGLAVEEYRVVCPRQGRDAILVLNAAPLTDAAGARLGAVLVLRDVTRLEDLERRVRNAAPMPHIVAGSPRMRGVLDMVRRLADLDTTVLITGESGTGKECIAEALHRGGRRCQAPLITVNCSALPEGLLESELFGHAKGAFTGAVRHKTGRFEAAQGGTIFLDEIGDISPHIQLKLLRFLEKREFERLGETKTIRSDARVVAATNANLEERLRRGLFREDLYYRLKVMVLTLPPLRERLDDLPALAAFFLSRFGASLGKSLSGASAAVLDRLAGHAWPGNVRELKHVLEHACILCPGGVVELEHLPPDFRDAPPSVPDSPRPRVPVATPASIEEALAQAGGNKAKAARLLGLSRQTLYRKLMK